MKPDDPVSRYRSLRYKLVVDHEDEQVEIGRFGDGRDDVAILEADRLEALYPQSNYSVIDTENGRKIR